MTTLHTQTQAPTQVVESYVECYETNWSKSTHMTSSCQTCLIGPSFSCPILLAMAYRLFLGGLPSWMSKDDVGHWIFNITHVWPVNVEVKRRNADATLMVAFVGYKTFALQQAAQTALAGATCYGFRVTAKLSRDSVQGPVAAAKPPPPSPATPAKASVTTSRLRESQAKVLAKLSGVAAVSVEPQAKVLAQEVGMAAVGVEPQAKALTKEVGVAAVTVEPFVCVLADPRFLAPGTILCFCDM